MTGQLRLDDQVLGDAGVALVTASYVMSHNNAQRGTGVFDSMTGIGTQVEHYLKGMSVARAALGDAAKTASESVAMVMEESAALDTLISANLATGFAVRKGQR